MNTPIHSKRQDPCGWGELRVSRNLSNPTPHNMAITYAIGDIYGRDLLLERMYAPIVNAPYREKNEPKPTVAGCVSVCIRIWY